MTQYFGSKLKTEQKALFQVVHVANFLRFITKTKSEQTKGKCVIHKKTKIQKVYKHSYVSKLFF